MATPTLSRDGTLEIFDGAGTPLNLSVEYTDGDFKGPPFMQDQADVQAFESRGDIYAVVKVGRKPQTFSFSAHVTSADGLTSSSVDCVLDAVRKTGLWASATSTGSNFGNAHMLRVKWTCGSTGFIVDLKKCTLQASVEEGMPNKLSVEGTWYPLEDSDVSGAVA